MTAREALNKLENDIGTKAMQELHIVIRLTDDEDDTHMGGLASLSVDPGCTDTQALVMDCDTDPANCPLGDE